MNSLYFHNCLAPLSLHTGNAEYSDIQNFINSFLPMLASSQQVLESSLLLWICLFTFIPSTLVTFHSLNFFSLIKCKSFLPVLPSTRSSLIYPSYSCQRVTSWNASLTIFLSFKGFLPGSSLAPQLVTQGPSQTDFYLLLYFHLWPVSRIYSCTGHPEQPAVFWMYEPVRGLLGS